MESDEKYIKSRFGKAQPFRVPDGYFDSLAQSAIGMARPQQTVLPKRTWWQLYRRYVAAAACALFVLGGASAYLAWQHGGRGTGHAVMASGGSVTSGHVQTGFDDDELDYTMLDNEGMYSLMASN